MRQLLVSIGVGVALGAAYLSFMLSLKAPVVLTAGTVPSATGTVPLAVSQSAAATVSTGAAPSVPSAAPSARSRTEKRTFDSALLRRKMPYTVWLPPGYDSRPEQRYPVVYLLHGGGGVNSEWADYGVLDAADRLMARGAIAPLILVLPQGDQEYWVDHVVDRATGANGEKWGTYTAREVVPEIDRRYRTLAAPAGRAIGGLSMGGHGALQLSLNFPGIWNVVGAHSPSLRPVGDAPTYLGTGAEFASRDPLALIRSRLDVAKTLNYWIDQGEADPWRTPVGELHDLMLSLGIAHTFKVLPGDHSLQYWSIHVEEYLRYYADALCRRPGTCPGPLGR